MMIFKKLGRCLNTITFRNITSRHIMFLDAEAFWQLIHLSDQEADSDASIQSENLKKSLAKLSDSEIAQFFNRYNFCVHQAYQWKVWHAVTIIHKECTPNLFLQFIDACIAKGKFFYHNVLTEPDFLAQYSVLSQPGPTGIISNLAADFINTLHPLRSHRQYSFEPLLQGTVVDREEFSLHYPELIKKFGMPVQEVMSA